jgi:hypothetical protein
MSEYNPDCLCCEKRKLIDSLLRNAALLSQRDLDMIIKMSEKLAGRAERLEGDR